MLKKITAIAIAALGVTAGAAAFAQTGPANPTVDPSTPTTVAPHAQAQGEGQGRGAPGRALIGRTVHGDLIVRDRDGAFQHVTVDRGKLTAVDGDKLTIERPDGPKVTVTVTSDTRYLGVSGKDALQVGQPTVIVSKAGTAVAVGQRQPGAEGRRGPGRPGRPGAGADTSTTAA